MGAIVIPVATMGCVNDHPLYMFSIASALNFLPWIFVNFNPLSAIMSLFIAINLGIIGSMMLAVTVPGIDLNNIASSLPLLIGMSAVLYLMIQLAVGLAVMFGILAIFGSAIVINKAQVEATFDAAFGINMGDGGFYAMVGLVILIIFFSFYWATKSYWIAVIMQTLIYSLLVTVSIHFLYEASANDFVVCCYMNTSAEPEKIYTCPIYLWWWWWCVFGGIVLIRALLFFWYFEYEKKQFLKRYKKIEDEENAPKVRYAGTSIQDDKLRLVY